MAPITNPARGSADMPDGDANISSAVSRLRHAPPFLLWLPVACLAVLALVIRIRLAGANEFPTVDGVEYMVQARYLLDHGIPPFSCFPPGWPLLISVPLLWLDRSDPMALLRAAQGVNVVAGTLLVLLTFRLLRRRLGYPLALLGMTVMALLPENLILSKGDLSDTTYACGLLVSWLLYEKGRKGSAGLMFGLTYLIRPEAILAGVGLLAHEIRRTRKPPRTMILGLLVPILPYLVFIRLASGAWGLSSKDVALSQSLSAHPGFEYFALIRHNLTALAPLLTGMLGLPLVILACWGLVRARNRWLWMLLPLLPVPLIINPMVPRFWQPYVPFFLLGAGLAGKDLAGRIRTGRPLAAAVLVVLAMGGFYQATRDDMIFVEQDTEAYYGLKDAGTWLRPRVQQKTIIAAYKPYTSFWAGCRFTRLPDEDNTEALVAWVRNSGARYLIVNVLVAHTQRKALDPLLQKPLPKNLADKLELVQLFQYDLVEHNTAVYRVKQTP